MKLLISRLVLLMSMLAITACGFQLRGAAELPDELKLLYVQGVNMQRDLGLELRRTLTRNGITVVDRYQEGAAVLSIIENNFERRVLSVSFSGKVSEYELERQVVIQLVDANSTMLIDAERFEARRDLQFDPDQVIGLGEEQRLLEVQMNEQLVQSILRRLSVL
ncbi:MAG: hypothetical protein JJU48_04525 [Methylophaga sp.]|nr:hypothetical protein [Methylophaga sp.]